MHPDTTGLRDDLEWIAVVQQLQNSKEALLSDFLTRFDGTEVYAGKVPRDEILELVRNTMTMYLTLLTGNSLEQDLALLPTNLGRRRVRQGVGLEQLLEGVRTNTRVIWSGLRAVAAESSEACLVRNADTLFALVEWHVREVQRAYLAEESAMMRDRERRERIAISRLFDEDQPDADELDALAEVLGLDAGSALTVVAQLGVHGAECAICTDAASRTFVHEFAAGSYHFGIVGADLDGLAAKSAAHGSGLVDQVPGLGALHAATRLASSLARVSASRERERGSVATFGEQVGDSGRATPLTSFDAWPELAWASLRDAVPVQYLPVSLQGFSELSTEQQRRMRETVLEYFATGSIKITAQRLFCHRNTIVKRLATFESVTGLDLSVPRECALAVIAFSAYR